MAESPRFSADMFGYMKNIEGIQVSKNEYLERLIDSNAPLPVPELAIYQSSWTHGKLTHDYINTTHGPALAEFKGKLYMAYKGSGVDQRIWISTFDGNSWSAPKTIGDPSWNPPNGQAYATASSPTLAVDENSGRLYMAWRQTDSKIYFAWFNGTRWQNQIATGETSSHTPALASHNAYLYMAWKHPIGTAIFVANLFPYSTPSVSNIVNLGMLDKFFANTSDKPALSVYDEYEYNESNKKIEAKSKLLLAWKGSGDNDIWYGSFSGLSVNEPDMWTAHKNIPNEGATTNGPAIASYSKYWTHSQVFDPVYKDIYMVWKNSTNTSIYESTYRINEFSHIDTDPSGNSLPVYQRWTTRRPISSSHTTTDAPALAEYNGKLYMAWRVAGTSNKIHFSQLEVGPEHHVRNIFDETRPGKAVVRQEDLAVFRIETRNMTIVSNIGTNAIPQLRRSNNSQDAYLILHMPPQSFGERVFFQTEPQNSNFENKEIDDNNPKYANEPIDSEKPLPPIQARIAHESRLVFIVPRGYRDIEYTLEGILRACQELPLNVSTSTELPGATTTAIEMPWRMILSPNENARWRHALIQSTSDFTNNTELFHMRMVAPDDDGNEILSPYPDPKRNTRVTWALSGLGEEAAMSTDGKLIPMKSDYPGSIGFPASTIIPFRMALDNFDRYQIAHLTSNTGMGNFPEPYNPIPLDTNTLMLSPLGGWLELRGAWDSNYFSLMQWSHRATMGRDHFVRVVYRGFLYPFGHRVSLIKVSERKFGLNERSDYSAYLHQRMYLVVNEKERLYNDDNLFVNVKNGNDNLARKFPFKRVKLLTEVTPDLDQPNNGKSSITKNNESLGQQMFWPHVGGEIFKFQCSAIDLEGRRVTFDIPMIFVDSMQALARNNGGTPAYNDAIKSTKIARDEYQKQHEQGGKGFLYNTAELNYQRVALAKPDKPGDTSVQVKSMRFSGYTEEIENNNQVKNSTLGIYSQNLTRPLWIPQVEEIEARIDAIANLSGSQDYNKLTFNDDYLKNDFGSSGNIGEVFVDINADPYSRRPLLDFSKQGDKSGGFIQPNLKPLALSRFAGPVMNDVSSFMRGNIPSGAGFPVLEDYEENVEYLFDIPLPLLFGCIPLGAIIKGASGAAGIKKQIPKFVTEVASKVDSFIGDLSRLLELASEAKSQAMNISKGALLAYKETLEDIKLQSLAYPVNQMNPINAAIDNLININNEIINLPLSSFESLTSFLTNKSYSSKITALENAANAETNGVPIPAGIKQSILIIVCKLKQLLSQLIQIPSFINSGEALVTDLFAIVGSPSNIDSALKNPNALSTKLDKLQTSISDFKEKLASLDLLDGAPKNVAMSALKAVEEVLNSGIVDLVKSLTGEELTTRFDWNPEIQSWPNTTNPLFRANDTKGLLVSVEAKVKKNGTSSPKISVVCSLKHFDLVLIAPATFIELSFEKIEFTVDSAAKTSVDVLLSDIKFMGVLGFVEVLKDLIPLDGFSDPPYLDISAKGIDAGFTISLPAICIGVMSLSNLSLTAGFTVPFIGEPLSVRFAFCRREQPFNLSVLCLGGGGFFGITIDPSGVQVLEASFEFGATLALNFGVASGSVYAMAGIYFRMEKGDASLTGYFRVGGKVSVLGLITASIELYLDLTYEFSTGKCVGKAQLSIKVSIAFFSKTVTIKCERKFAGSNGDPTLRQMYGYLPEISFNEEYERIDETTNYPWREYMEAFSYEEV
ncbi:MAG: glycoside hydrolase [Oscillospiraceae bacterium]|nr:glycoside hydrolase [Oscillospiraceae bacterium]